jgi:hypothetical protein
LEESTLKILPKLIFKFLWLILRGKQDIVLENLALRQQLAVQQRSIKRRRSKMSIVFSGFGYQESGTIGDTH